MSYSNTIVRAAEETKARRVFRSDGKGDVESPAYQCTAYNEELPDVQFVRAVYGGTKTMRAKGKEFLPQHAMEVDAKWNTRLQVATALNALKTTVEGLSGMIFRRDPTLDEQVPEVIVKHMENVDLRGNSLAVFAHRVADDALTDGHSWIMVEAPSSTARTQKEAEEQGLQPYWIKITKQQAHNRRWEIRNGKPVLTLFAFHETHTEQAGAFGERQVPRIRALLEGALDPATGVRGNVQGQVWELTQVEEDDPKGGKRMVDKWLLVQEYELPVGRVPVVFVPSNDTDEFTSEPPLQDLAYEQVEFYRVRSERQKALTFSSIAVPYVFGQNVCDENGVSAVKWGSDGMLLLNDPEASAGMLESQGFGLTAQKEELAAIKENMATLGLRMLQKEPSTQPHTATAEILGKSESSANLATFATDLEVALTEALGIHAEYRSDVKPEQVGKVKVNRDFHEQMLSSADIKALGDEVARGHLSLDTMWDMMVEGEWLPEEFDKEEERGRIEEDSAARLAEMQELFGTPGQPGGQPPEGGGAPPSPRPPIQA